MTTQSTTRERVKPVHAFAGALHTALDRVSVAPAWAMSPSEQAQTLVELTRAVARLTELRLRVLAAGDLNDLGAPEGSTSTAAWLAHATQHTRATCQRDLRLARRLDEPISAATREAFAAGMLNLDQMQVVLACVQDLSADHTVSEEQVVRAQRHLVGLAATQDAVDLRISAAKIFEVLAPEEAERREGEALERDERRARETSRFTLSDNGDGTSSGRFKLPAAQAAMLTKVLQAYAAPRRTDPATLLGPDGKKLPHRVLLGQAFADLIEHLPLDRLPQSGGAAATIVVTTSLATLRSALGSGTLDSGTPISASQARRLACTSGLIPAVLGSASQPLDLGRRVRLHTTAQRTAMALRDAGCTAEGCDRPPAWCEAHHDTPWSQGGETSLQNGRLLCVHHHHLAHDSHYDQRRLPDGRVRFHKRT